MKKGGLSVLAEELFTMALGLVCLFVLHNKGCWKVLCILKCPLDSLFENASPLALEACYLAFGFLVHFTLHVPVTPVYLQSVWVVNRKLSATLM